MISERSRGTSLREKTAGVPRIYFYTDEGIREQSPKHESLFHWPLIRSAESVGEHVFVMVDRNAGLIVPHRAFASAAEREQFLAEIRSRSVMMARGTEG